MKNWKKVTAGILTVMMAASLAACGGTKEAKTIAGKEDLKGAVIGVQLGTCLLYTSTSQIKKRWEGWEEESRADHCVKCGKCETVCPQKISIREDLAKVAAEMKAL